MHCLIKLKLWDARSKRVKAVILLWLVFPAIILFMQRFIKSVKLAWSLEFGIRFIPCKEGC